MVDWDLLDEPWDEFGTWQKTGAGTSVIDPAGQLRQLGSGRKKTLGGGLPTQYMVEVRLKVDGFYTTKFYSYMLYDGEHYVGIGIYEDKITCQCNGENQEIALATSEDIFLVWRFVVDSAGDSIKVYVDDIYIGEFTDLSDIPTDDGRIETRSFDVLAHEDYFRIASGLHIPTRPPAIFVNPTIQERKMCKTSFKKRLFVSSMQTRNLDPFFIQRNLALSSFRNRKMKGVWSD